MVGFEVSCKSVVSIAISLANKNQLNNIGKMSVILVGFTTLDVSHFVGIYLAFVYDINEL